MLDVGLADYLGIMIGVKEIHVVRTPADTEDDDDEEKHFDDL